jgi:hypothetical protein
MILIIKRNNGETVEKKMQVKAEKSKKTSNQVYLQVSHELVRPKMYVCSVRGH